MRMYLWRHDAARGCRGGDRNGEAFAALLYDLFVSYPGRKADRMNAVMKNMLAGTLLVGLIAAAPPAAQEPHEAPRQQSITGSYQVDPVHTSVIFKVKHLGVSYFYGNFNEVAGTFSIDEADPAKSTFDIQIKAESIDSREKARDMHLKGPDFFNAKRYPLIEFKATSVSRSADGGWDVTGDLKLLGVSRPMSLKLVHTGAGLGMTGEQLAGFETQFTVKRSDFGMTFMIDKLGDDVQILCSVEGIKK
jgi:polyisoprenoid-binding protein YceI